MVGRDRELEAIAALLDSEPDEPRVLLIEGEAGIGKTTVWRAGVQEARGREYRVLACSGVSSETLLSFTAVRDLLGDDFDEIAAELSAPQRHALDVVLLREEPSARPPDQGTIAVAFAAALGALAARRPTLLAIDDVQWLDVASTAPIQYALRRADQLELTVLLARRLDGDAETEPGLEPSEYEQLHTIRLDHLSVGALGRLLHAALGSAYPRPTLQRLHAVSGGNPFFALELARALGQPATPLRPGAALPVPETLRGVVRERLLGLPAKTLELLTVASAVTRPTITLLGLVLGLDPSPFLDAAVEANVATVAGGDLRFTHPLYAATVYDLARPTRRHEIHRRLAELVPDPEERARHLALAADGPDAELARSLEDAAGAAFNRGAPAAAAELVAQARHVTPADEPDQGWRRALAESNYQFAAGDTGRASMLLDELVATTPSGPRRARVLSRQARLRHFERDVATSVSLLYEALAEAQDEAALRGEIEEGLAWGLLLVRRDLPAAVDHARSAAELAEQRGDRAAQAEALAVQGLLEFVLGREWHESMKRALSLEEFTRDLRVLRQPSFAHGYCLSCGDDLDGARVVFEELLRRTEQDGDESSVPSILNHLTLIECLSGKWEASAAYAEECHARAVESGQGPTQTSILGKLALLAARRGAFEQAREYASEGLFRAGGVDVDRLEEAMAGGGETAIWTLGFVALFEDRPDDAHRLLGPMTDALLAAGIEEPGEVRCLPDEIEALIALGRFEDAEALLRRLEGWARRLERPSTLAVAYRCRGSLLAESGNSAASLEAFEEAAAWEARAGLPFERARTLLALGRQQRRARQRKAARDTLHLAAEIFDELGAAPWTARARAEFARTGGRLTRSGELTPTELLIAELVADGKTNSEVAATLAVAQRTVESALTQIYRKLEVRSRTELARRLAETTPAGD